MKYKVFFVAVLCGLYASVAHAQSTLSMNVNQIHMVKAGGYSVDQTGGGFTFTQKVTEAGDRLSIEFNRTGADFLTLQGGVQGVVGPNVYISLLGGVAYDPTSHAHLVLTPGVGVRKSVGEHTELFTQVDLRFIPNDYKNIVGVSVMFGAAYRFSPGR